MAWSKPSKGRANQIGLVQIYRRAAGLDRPEYIRLLHEHTGAWTSRAPFLTQWHFDIFMPVLEMLVEQRVEQTGAKLPKQIQNLHYWRDRAPGRGKMSSRQRHMITNPDGTGLWDQLMPRLRPEHQNYDYLTGIARKASHRPVTHIFALTGAQATALIEALKNRLRYAIRKAG